jgi:hypothetical protein
MMATTHVLAGMLLGLAVAPLAPGAGPLSLVLAGAAGGLAPDLDALGEHRRDLHAPVFGTVVAGGLLGLVVVTAWPPAALLTAFVGAAGLHAASDALGGGRSLRPWDGGVERAVYCHVQGRWWRPRELIPYDGSPHDLALAAGLGLVALAAIEAPVIEAIVGGLLVVSLGYALVRKRVPAVVDWLTKTTRRQRG